MSLMTMLRTTGTLQRKTATKDAAGGMEMAFAAVSSATNVKCDIQPASGSIRLQYQQMQAVVTHSVYLGSDISAEQGDIFVSNGRTFHFRGYRKPAPGYQSWPAIMDVEEQS